MGRSVLELRTERSHPDLLLRAPARSPPGGPAWSQVIQGDIRGYQGDIRGHWDTLTFRVHPLQTGGRVAAVLADT